MKREKVLFIPQFLDIRRFSFDLILFFKIFPLLTVRLKDFLVLFYMINCFINFNHLLHVLLALCALPGCSGKPWDGKWRNWLRIYILTIMKIWIYNWDIKWVRLGLWCVCADKIISGMVIKSFIVSGQWFTCRLVLHFIPLKLTSMIAF